jgi:predicted nucleic acid-binding protein
MNEAFLDTSALLKLYKTEKGSKWLAAFVALNSIIVSELVLFEMANVIWRLHLDGGITESEASKLIRQVRLDSANYDVIDLGGDEQLNKLIEVLAKLPTTLRVRSLDSIHLTTAEVVRENLKTVDPKANLIFVSADVQLLRIAQARGFKTENPEDHL